jgi:predicted PurR-regulated permease PerM
LLVYLGIFAGIVLISLIVVPPITTEARIFWEELPTIVGDLAEEWRTSPNPFLSTTGYRFLVQLEFRIENPPPPTGDTAISLITSTGGIIFGIIATFVIGFYYLMEKRLVRQVALDFVRPEARERFNTIWDDVEVKVGDWLRGQLLLMLTIGVLAGIGYAIIGVRFWLLLAVVAGITELIPIVGPWIGGIPAVAIALIDSWQKAILVAAFLVLLQLAENTILVPRIMRNAVGLSPLAVFIAVLAGAEFYGPLGALLALPVAAALQVIIQDSLRMRRANWELEAAGFDTTMPTWREIVTQFLGDHDERRRAGPVDPAERDAPSTEQGSSQGERD